MTTDNAQHTGADCALRSGESERSEWIGYRAAAVAAGCDRERNAKDRKDMKPLLYGGADSSVLTSIVVLFWNGCLQTIDLDQLM